MSEDELVVKVYEVNTLPNTARQLVEAIRDQKDLSMDEALEMADYLDERYKMSDYVPVNLKKFGKNIDGKWKMRRVV
jgi:hypothetical protein